MVGRGRLRITRITQNHSVKRKAVETWYKLDLFIYLVKVTSNI
jgi:hypothetical protein